ncbi:MAG: UDP-N-acetylglucosamine--N-acetylmuramyl-(pentapeptide) pyrophosphoryl-undecaprenol N-acetylglucosamine transferase, partial [Bacteroidetes bacterium]|nr:UDP-N-acetylglucosamine--N-acetylmuramyl-(pentapeptide) pyrophosphoryl-undecaprenol N-acetylglucosamine transferase [Bacteroidota bacterium]
TKNAMALVNKNAALMIKDNEAVKKLGNVLVDLLNNDQQQKILAEHIKMLAKSDAANEIVQEIVSSK